MTKLWFYAIFLSCLIASSLCRCEILSLNNWKGRQYEIKGLSEKRLTAIGYPERDKSQLQYAGKNIYPPGVYRLKLELGLSHTHDAVAWYSNCIVTIKNANCLSPNRWQGIYFRNPDQPDVKTVDFVLLEPSTLTIALALETDGSEFAKQAAKASLKSGELEQRAKELTFDKDTSGSATLGLDHQLEPSKNSYVFLDNATLEKLSGSAYVSKLSVNKICYKPKEALHAEVTLTKLAKVATGTLNIYLESGLNHRQPVKTIPVKLSSPDQTFEVDVKLPEETDLGYALVAEYRSADGKDISSKSDYFTITDNIYRTAIHYIKPITGITLQDTEWMRKRLAGLKNNYINCQEIFFWAEEDMVEMSPDDEVWFSGQTSYQISKKGLKDYIRIAHDLGIAVTTYGKFIMSGYLGWQTAYNYPYDHKDQYGFGIGMWEGADVASLDHFMNKEFLAASPIKTGYFQRLEGLPFMPINPDPTPGNVKRAADEVVRSIKMFNWDAVRWDGHPKGFGRSGSSCGGINTNRYSYAAQKKTQMLVRYFKDLVKQEKPDFRHGYNYFHTQPKPDTDWAIEDFELDELAADGGLLMNESIRNSGGKTFKWFAENLQVEGDLCRERGGFFLSIFCDQASLRSTLLEYILYLAAGCRPYGDGVNNRILNRYATRYSAYVFDETLQRIAKSESILKPQSPTPLWWQPFVYETRELNQHKQLVVNFLNIPKNDVITDNKYPNLKLLPSTEPVAFNIDLPTGYTLKKADIIDPFTLHVTSLPINNSQLTIPAVNIWRALIIDVEVKADTPALAETLGVPKTLGKTRPKISVPREEPEALDISKTVVDVNKRMEHLFVKPGVQWWKEDEQLINLSMTERNRKLVTSRQPLEHYTKKYPYGVKIPDDLKLKNANLQFPDVTPIRNGLIDIFYARGAMDYKLNLYDGFARLDRFHVKEAQFECPFSGKHFSLNNNLAPAEMKEFDVLIYADIPHAAIGVQNAYAMNHYINSGGSALFFGGEYSFGKGRYAYTILDREILPVTIIQSLDNRYVREPVKLQPGEDFADLKCTLDFNQQPAVWCWNEVALKDNVKVFLKAGNRPILVGWDHGKGRVACFLGMYKGKSENGTTAFFDWQDWPALMKAVLNWLAPNAMTDQPEKKQENSATLNKARESLTGNLLEDMINDLDGDLGNDATNLPNVSQKKAATLSKKELSLRIAAINMLLQARDQKALPLLLDQLPSVANLPMSTRLNIIAAILNETSLKKKAATVARQSLNSSDPHVRGMAYLLSAASGDKNFVAMLDSSPSATETRPDFRELYLSLAIALYPKKDLLTKGEAIIQQLNSLEHKTMVAYTGGKGFSMAAPETVCLDSGQLLTRLCWLSYMAKWQPEKYATQFAREWAMTGLYLDYCDRSMKNLKGSLSKPGPKAKNLKQKVDFGIANLELYKKLLTFLNQELTPQMRSLFITNPQLCCLGFANARFLAQMKQIINLLGYFPPQKEKSQLNNLSQNNHPFLSRFCRQRLTGLDK